VDDAPTREHKHRNDQPVFADNMATMGINQGINNYFATNDDLAASARRGRDRRIAAEAGERISQSIVRRAG
jgi:hypothetical protein